MKVAERMIDPALLVLGFAVSLLPFLWWEGVGLDLWVLVFCLWGTVPFALIVFFRHLTEFSFAGVIATAIALAAMAVAAQIDIHRSDSSTAGIGFLFYPAWLTALVSAALALDLMTRAVLRHLARRDVKASNG